MFIVRFIDGSFEDKCSVSVSDQVLRFLSFASSVSIRQGTCALLMYDVALGIVYVSLGVAIASDMRYGLLEPF